MPKPTTPLTTRELECVRLAAKDFTTETTAIELKIGYETAKQHRATAMSKLGVGSISGAVLACERLGILEPRTHTKGPWRWINENALVGDHGRRPAVLAAKDLRQRGEGGLLVPFDPTSPDGRLIEDSVSILGLLRDLHDRVWGDDGRLPLASQADVELDVKVRAMLARFPKEGADGR